MVYWKRGPQTYHRPPRWWLWCLPVPRLVAFTTRMFWRSILRETCSPNLVRSTVLSLLFCVITIPSGYLATSGVIEIGSPRFVNWRDKSSKMTILFSPILTPTLPMSKLLERKSTVTTNSGGSCPSHAVTRTCSQMPRKLKFCPRSWKGATSKVSETSHVLGGMGEGVAVKERVKQTKHS